MPKKIGHFKYAPRRTGIDLADDDAAADWSGRGNDEVGGGDCQRFANSRPRSPLPAAAVPTLGRTALEPPLAVGNFSNK